MTVREKIQHFERMVRDIGGTIPTEVLCKLAVDSGIEQPTAMLEFIDACYQLHVDTWAFGRSQDEYRKQHAIRQGRVNIWAAVLRHIPLPVQGVSTKQAAEDAAGVKP